MPAVYRKTGDAGFPLLVAIGGIAFSHGRLGARRRMTSLPEAHPRAVPHFPKGLTRQPSAPSSWPMRLQFDDLEPDTPLRL